MNSKLFDLKCSGTSQNEDHKKMILKHTYFLLSELLKRRYDAWKVGLDMRESLGNHHKIDVCVR